MRCASCGADNPEPAKFCIECAAPFPRRCPRCGTENPPRAKLCAECATALSGQPAAAPPPPLGSSPPSPVSYTPRHLAARILAEQAAMEARGAIEGERRIITALFADLAGFTALARDLDPEETRHIIDPALQLMMEAVHRYEGYVAQPLGDGIFALFGAPIAHEDHPQRALYAALRMQHELRRYADQVRVEKGVPLQLRVGINTGEVVLRSIRKDDLHTDYVPVGHSTNLASRMEGLANPGSMELPQNNISLSAILSYAAPYGQPKLERLVPESVGHPQ
jgi:class 3 adenylate cyclase